MSTDTTPTNESLVSIADRHRRLKQASVALDAVTHASTRCDGPNTDTETPAFTTELVLARGYDVVPPTVLEAIAECDLGIGTVDPQGSGAQAQLVVQVH